jgi:hypothetical protein
MLDPIANHNRDRIALLHSYGEQSIRQLVYPRIQFAVSNVPKAILRSDLDRQLVSVSAQAVAHQHWGIHFRFSILRRGSGHALDFRLCDKNSEEFFPAKTPRRKVKKFSYFSELGVFYVFARGIVLPIPAIGNRQSKI